MTGNELMIQYKSPRRHDFTRQNDFMLQDDFTLPMELTPHNEAANSVRRCPSGGLFAGIWRWLAATILVCVVLCVRSSSAGEFNEAKNIGDPAPVFENLPATDGKQYSLEDFKDKDFLLIVFTCNSCPVATDYEDRIIGLSKEFGGEEGKLELIAINVNTIEEDRLPAMKERAKEKSFPFVYLFDETQKIAREFGATTTPEFFLLDKDRKIVFMGGMDDSGTPSLVKQEFLRPAIKSLLAGTTPEKAESPPLGCLIRYERKRRAKK